MHTQEKNTYKNICGPKIQALRMQAQLSEAELSKELEAIGIILSESNIREIEARRREVYDVELKVLSKFFQVSYEFLIG